jgi:NitT/TauT family transport system substrate-binding protein
MVSPRFNSRLTRRQWLRYSGLAAASMGTAALLNSCDRWRPPVDDPVVRVGYLPITDASALLAAYDKGFYRAEGLEASRPKSYRSWAAIAQGFMDREVNVIHILMPTAIWMRYGAQFPSRVVAWNHTNGSALTVLPTVNQVTDLGGRSLAIPSWYSIHNVVLQMLLRHHGLTPMIQKPGDRVAADQVGLQVLSPLDMLDALQLEAIAGYIVAEPYNSAAETRQSGKILRLTGDVWKDHACCVVLMHDDDVQNRPDWTQRIVNAVVKAQQWAQWNRPELAHLLSQAGGNYMPHSLAILERVLTHNDHDFYRRQGAIQHPEWRSRRVDFQPYPFPSYTEALIKACQTTQFAEDVPWLNSLDPTQSAAELVDPAFVRQALDSVGGPQAFGLALDLNRTELIQV